VSAAGGLVDVGADLPAEDIPPEALLTQGLHEVTSLLVTEFTLDDVLRVILETIYRALGVSRTRAFFLLKDAALPKARFRFGMGQSPADMRTWMEVPLKGTQDLFVLALNQARDLVIKDLRSPDLDPLIPEWVPPHHARAPLRRAAAARGQSEERGAVLRRRRRNRRRSPHGDRPQQSQGAAQPGRAGDPSEHAPLGGAQALMSHPCIITAAITGSVPRKDNNPAVPITVGEQIESTHACYEAGAALVHVHVRNDDQSTTSNPDKFADFQERHRRTAPT
jgi:hypothetical protein